MAGQIRFRPNAEDYIATMRAAWLNSLLSRRFVFRMAVIIAAFIAIGIAISSEADVDDRLVVIAVIGGGAFSGLAICVGLSFLLIPRRSRRLFLQQRTLARDFDVEWTEAHLAYRSDISTSTIAWSDYHKWHEGGGVFLFYLNDGLNHFVPKRALTPEQIIDLRKTARTFAPARR